MLVEVYASHISLLSRFVMPILNSLLQDIICRKTYLLVRMCISCCFHVQSIYKNLFVLKSLYINIHQIYLPKTCL